MSKIKRIVANKTKIMSATIGSSILGTFTGKCCDAAVFNNNDMKLNRELFENLFASDEYKDAIKRGYYIGFLGHPEDPACQDFEHACIVMKECHITDDDEIEGTFDLIDTPVGRIAKSFIDAGVQWGISIRGAGDVDAEGNVDPDTFVFRGFDLVAFPAYNDAVPEFQQIAASKNLDDQVKYKRVCATINKNLDKVNDIKTIEAMQEQFNPDSEEYKKLEARKTDIGIDDENCPECSKEDKEEIMGKKIRSVTEMYMEQLAENKKLKATLASTQAKYERELKSIKRITASQNKLMQERLDNAEAINKKLNSKLDQTVEANRKLNDKLIEVKASNSKIVRDLDKSEKNNLIYKQKIESSSQDLSDKDTIIAELQSKLDKTVIATTKATREASNRGEQIEGLKSEITASKQELGFLEERVQAMEDMLGEYQQAYANIYANAVGIQASGLTVTAATSVRDLENLIKGATNTANMGVCPDYGEIIPVDDEENNDDSDLAVL